MQLLSIFDHQFIALQEGVGTIDSANMALTQLPFLLTLWLYFPADRNRNTHANKASANMALKRMGHQGKQTAHGLRGLARTTISDRDFAYAPSEACLSHKVVNSVSQSYNHSTYLNQRIKIMEWWSQHIEDASYGKLSMAGTKGLKVVGG